MISQLYKVETAEIMCNLTQVISTFFVYSSWYTLIVIAADRYRLVNFQCFMTLKVIIL